MPFLALQDVRKSYGGRPALRGAALEVEVGEIHALLGENGAGKTTLMNVLYGLLGADGGEMRLEGKPYTPSSPKEAMAAGVGMVHQHFMLVPTLTVAENVLLGDSPWTRYPDRNLVSRMRHRAAELGFDLPFGLRVDELSVGELQRVEIFKLLWKGGRLLILDEPTAVLSPGEVEELFKLLKTLRREGRSILFISHKLEEIRALCDRVTVLRKGSTIATVRLEEKTNAELARMMVGREIEPTDNLLRNSSEKPKRIVLPTEGRNLDGLPLQSAPTVEAPPIEVTPSNQRGCRYELERKKKGAESAGTFRAVCRGTGRGKLKGNWTLAIPAGEITAIAGIEGNGQRELAETLLGLRSFANVEVYEGEELLTGGVRERIESGIGFISEDRQRTGLVLDFTLTENLALKDISQSPWSKRGWLNRKDSKIRAVELVRRFDIQPPDPDRPAASLSGGNQQKVVVARELSRNRRLLVAANPTRGLDIGARSAVHQALLDAASEGTAILLLSTELEEILELADTVHALHAGEVEPVPREDWSRERIGLAMTGAAKNRGEA